MLEFPKKSKIEGFPVNDVETGAPLAFMAAKLLAKKDSKVLTMLGASDCQSMLSCDHDKSETY